VHGDPELVEHPSLAANGGSRYGYRFSADPLHAVFEAEYAHPQHAPAAAASTSGGHGSSAGGTGAGAAPGSPGGEGDGTTAAAASGPDGGHSLGRSRFRIVPAPRYHHATLTVGNGMYLFGGCNDNAVMMDLWRLDLVTYTWTKVGPPNRPLTHTPPHVAALEAAAAAAAERERLAARMAAAAVRSPPNRHTLGSRTNSATRLLLSPDAAAVTGTTAGDGDSVAGQLTSRSGASLTRQPSGTALVAGSTAPATRHTSVSGPSGGVQGAGDGASVVSGVTWAPYSSPGDTTSPPAVQALLWPPPSYGGSLCLDPDPAMVNRRLYLVGGRGPAVGTTSAAGALAGAATVAGQTLGSAHVWRFDILTGLWEAVDPAATFKHATAASGGVGSGVTASASATTAPAAGAPITSPTAASAAGRRRSLRADTGGGGGGEDGSGGGGSGAMAPAAAAAREDGTPVPVLPPARYGHTLVAPSAIHLAVPIPRVCDPFYAWLAAQADAPRGAAAATTTVVTSSPVGKGRSSVGAGGRGGPAGTRVIPPALLDPCNIRRSKRDMLHAAAGDKWADLFIPKPPVDRRTARQRAQEAAGLVKSGAAAAGSGVEAPDSVLLDQGAGKAATTRGDAPMATLRAGGKSGRLAADGSGPRRVGILQHDVDKAVRALTRDAAAAAQSAAAGVGPLAGAASTASLGAVGAAGGSGGAAAAAVGAAARPSSSSGRAGRKASGGVVDAAADAMVAEITTTAAVTGVVDGRRRSLVLSVTPLQQGSVGVDALNRYGINVDPGDSEVVESPEPKVPTSLRSALTADLMALKGPGGTGPSMPTVDGAPPSRMVPSLQTLRRVLGLASNDVCTLLTLARLLPAWRAALACNDDGALQRDGLAGLGPASLLGAGGGKPGVGGRLEDGPAAPSTAASHASKTICVPGPGLGYGHWSAHAPSVYAELARTLRSFLHYADWRAVGRDPATGGSGSSSASAATSGHHALTPAVHCAVSPRQWPLARGASRTVRVKSIDATAAGSAGASASASAASATTGAPASSAFAGGAAAAAPTVTLLSAGGLMGFDACSDVSVWMWCKGEDSYEAAANVIADVAASKLLLLGGLLLPSTPTATVASTSAGAPSPRAAAASAPTNESGPLVASGLANPRDVYVLAIPAVNPVGEDPYAAPPLPSPFQEDPYTAGWHFPPHDGWTQAAALLTPSSSAGSMAGMGRPGTPSGGLGGAVGVARSIVGSRVGTAMLGAVGSGAGGGGGGGLDALGAIGVRPMMASPLATAHCSLWRVLQPIRWQQDAWMLHRVALACQPAL